MSNPLTKELVRAWLKRRLENPEPPPDMEQIRREVGWAATDREQEAFGLRKKDGDPLFA